MMIIIKNRDTIQERKTLQLIHADMVATGFARDCYIGRRRMLLIIADPTKTVILTKDGTTSFWACPELYKRPRSPTDHHHYYHFCHHHESQDYNLDLTEDRCTQAGWIIMMDHYNECTLWWIIIYHNDGSEVLCAPYETPDFLQMAPPQTDYWGCSLLLAIRIRNGHLNILGPTKKDVDSVDANQLSLQM